jgi:aminomethyltransferase
LIKGRPAGLVPCGLGARDTLRLEAGYLLYGQDLDEHRTPLEAGYDWVVRFDKGEFQGKAALEKQKREGLKSRLTGFKLLEAGVPRPGCRIFVGGEDAGTFVSATYSPTLKAGIGVGYVAPNLAAGAPAEIEVHGRRLKAEVHPTPFYKKGT